MELRLLLETALFELSGELDKTPRCNEKSMYALNIEAPGGKTALELLTLAFENNKPVSAIGLNSCSIHFQAEGVKRIVVSQ